MIRFLLILICATLTVGCNTPKQTTKKFVSPAELAIKKKPVTEREVMDDSKAEELLAEPVSMSGSYETLEFVSVNAPTVEVAKQETLGGKITYAQAYELALKSIYTDRNDEESPLEVQSSAMGFVPPGMDKLEADQIALRGSLQGGGKLCLVPMVETEDKCFPAEHGEEVKDNWIFLLTIETISDHLYWIVIPRDGVKKAYNYGFN